MLNSIIKKSYILLISFFCFFHSNYTMSMSSHLVLDKENSDTLPKNFRVLPELKMAGGGQFSSLGLKKILKYLPTKEVLILDLRQETHGFINGNAISWYSLQNAGNINKSPKEIEQEQQNLLSRLKQHSHTNVYSLLKKSQGEVAHKPASFPVNESFSEKDLATRLNLKYERIYTTDHHAPASREVDRFIEIVKNTSPSTWIYFHCRAGVGRTTTFMTMYDIMHHAKTQSFNMILSRQIKIGGKDLSKLPNPQEYKYTPAKERLGFLKQFYEYAKNNSDNFQTSWTSYIHQNKTNKN